MHATCEAMIHKAVVSPVVALAGLIDTAAGLAKIAQSAADRLAGDSRRRRTGTDAVGTA